MTNETREAETTKTTPSDLVGALVGVGAAWARYGLAVGRASLSASAKSLEVTSDVLERLSRAIEDTAENLRSRQEPEPPAGA